MSTVAQHEPTRAAVRGESVGFLVVEQRSTTPLGPKIVYANEELSKLSGYDPASLVGSPLGLLNDRSDLPSLIEKLPVIASRPNHCFMDRALLRNGGTRLACRWTIRATNREGEPRGHFALTVRPASRIESPVERVVTLPERAPALAPPAPAPVPLKAMATVGLDYETARSESIFLAAAGVAHDFKNALQTIKMNLELASENPREGRVNSNIAEAQLALDDAEMLARQMLAFTRGEAGHRRTIHPAPLLERASRLCSAGSSIRCRLFQIPPTEQLRCVEGDPMQIYQVLHNLVINARQAMPNGGTIDIVADNADLGGDNAYAMPPGRYLVISVRDKGCGIPPASLARIFDSSYSTKAGGSGIGLASCFAIVRAHRGALRVASEVGVGTEFLVFLPATEDVVEPDAAWAGPSLAPTPPVRLRRPGSSIGRVLVVEDQPGVARATLGILKRLGYESLHARDGQEAISLYREHLDSSEPVDVVLLDMTLPGGLSGYDVAAELLRLDRDARIVATSGYFEEGVDLPAQHRFAATLPKPYGKDKLSDALEQAVAV